jgi:hypothetical protein
MQWNKAALVAAINASIRSGLCAQDASSWPCNVLGHAIVGFAHPRTKEKGNEQHN